MFVDQEKAFKWIDRDISSEKLEYYDAKGQLLDNIRILFRNASVVYEQQMD